MKRTLSFEKHGSTVLVVAGTALVAATYGMVRLAYGLFLPEVQASLGLGDRHAGYVASGASIAYCVGALVGLGADVRPRVVVVLAASTGAVGGAGMALAPGPGAFSLLAVLGSAGAGLASPGLVALVARQVPPAGAPQAQARVNSGTGPGIVAAGLAALVLLPDWRTGFALGGALSLLAGAVVLFAARDRGHAPIVGGRLRPRALVLPATAALGLGAGSAIVWTYGRAHLVEHGASTTGSTLAWVALGLGGAATVLTASRLARPAPPAAWTLTTGTVAVAILALAVLPGQRPVAVLATTLFGWGFVAATSALIAWASEVTPERAAAGTSALFVLLVLGQAIGSAVAGELIPRAGGAVAFGSFALLTAGAAAAGLVGRGAGTASVVEQPAAARERGGLGATCGAQLGEDP